ncbi:MAG: PD-(D/E)XK nuclease family protein [Polyangiaceae bacterium]|nr:PD-(D/E)XK nuclease family protein [Polyangiaceae bacterium]
MSLAAHTIFVCPSAEARLTRAADFLRARTEMRITVVGPSMDAAAEVTRRALPPADRAASFGWQRTTLDVLAVQVARAELARRGLVPASLLALEAACVRLVHDHQNGLGRFAPIADRPGLPRALARTLLELRLAKSPALVDDDLTRLLHAFDRELEALGLADRARVFELAIDVSRKKSVQSAPVLLYDLPLHSRFEADFVRAVTLAAPAAFATVPAGDKRALALMKDALGERAAVDELHFTNDSALARLHHGLFRDHANVPLTTTPGDEVIVLSAPGESREAVEIVRLVIHEAARGTPFDEIAVVMRAPGYGVHLEEAFRRAKVPAFFAGGSPKPDPAGRALLTLLACAAEGLSARRFTEYLSLGEVPDDDDVSVAEEDRTGKMLRTPRHWERLIDTAAVIGGSDRWERRLAGLAGKLAMDLRAYENKGEDALAEVVRRDLDALTTLQSFALPIIEKLASLPGGPRSKTAAASWGEWLGHLRDLATCVLREPARVLEFLDELRPMADVGPVDLTEVRLVLEAHLSLFVVPQTGRRYGKVYVATIDEARGMSFDVVFVPGLAEKIFPQKVVEDPLLLDDVRRRISSDLPTNDDRTESERLLLRLAVGAAKERIVLSYPRLAVEPSRPRTPSFYGLEILRVAEGKLRGFEHLAETAARRVDARIGWPAPANAKDAIDEAEHDLALLDSILNKPEDQGIGEAHYLLTANDHLARALRFRGRRWLKPWRACDGLVDPPDEALAAIREHALDRRSFSPTALQNYAACPYRFFLSAVHKLAPRRELEPVEDLDPLTRGSLVHEVQFRLLTKLHAEGLLPVNEACLDRARAILDVVLREAATEAKSDLAPAIDRVFADAIESIGADLREWLRRMAGEPDWTPAFFELSFGLKDRRDQDAHSKDDPAALDVGIFLRGSIDLVEKHATGKLRATDHKTGKVRAKAGETVIGKGETLQPVLYALTIEKLFPGTKIEGGRLYYCTSAGDFTKVDIPLTREAREAARLVATTIGDALETGFLPAAPADGACKYCDFLPVCGPYEEIRTRRKARERMKPLMELRRHR